MRKSKVTRSATAIWLVGSTEESFRTSKLPSRGEVIRVLFHYHAFKQLSLKDSITETANQLLVIWEKANIPTKARNHVMEHIRKLHGEWQGLKKLINRASETNLANQEKFQEGLDDLFDVSHQDAMSLIRVDEDRKFLEAQREKGRRGTIGGLDRTLALQNRRVMRRRVEEVRRAAKSRSAVASINAVAVLDDSSSNGIISDVPSV
jgi:adenylate/nucleoside-diphosphate kinase